MLRRLLFALLLILAFAVGVLVPLTPAGAALIAALAPAPPPKPVLTVRGKPPTVSATAAYLLDADTGNVLVNVNGQQKLPMASTTKMMTAYIALQEAKLDTMVTVKQDAVDEVQKNEGSSAQLVAGDQLRLKDLLYALMLPSGDDAAIAIADALSGTPVAFVKKMNDYARRLGLKQTHYLNPDGLTSHDAQGKAQPDHYSSAADLVQLARQALHNSLFAQIVQLQRYVLPANGVHHAYIWENTDDLLSSYAGATGIKTGYTSEAGYCLVFAATNSEHHLIGTILHAVDAEHRVTDAKALLNWGFALPLLPPPPSS